MKPSGNGLASDLYEALRSISGLALGAATNQSLIRSTCLFHCCPSSVSTM